MPRAGAIPEGFTTLQGTIPEELAVLVRSQAPLRGMNISEAMAAAFQCWLAQVAQDAPKPPEAVEQFADAVIKVIHARLSDEDLRHIASAAIKSGVAKRHGRVAKGDAKGKAAKAEHARTGT